MSNFSTWTPEKILRDGLAMAETMLAPDDVIQGLREALLACAERRFPFG